MARLRTLTHTAVLALTLFGLGCSSQGVQKPPTTPTLEGPITPTPVSDDAFAQSVHRLVRDGKPTRERLALLAGVVRQQMTHASGRFTAGNPERGVEAVIGALHLIRKGEGRAEMIDASGERALAGALERINARGDEGRALALMLMRGAALPPGSPSKPALDEHLATLTRWMKETRTGGPMQRLYGEQRAAVSRAMVDTSEPTLAAAVMAVNAWIDRAVEYNLQFRQTGQRPEREEAIEASRALETGGVTMAALYLRNGDVRGALDQVERSAARRIIRPLFFERLRAAAESDGAREWQALTASLVRREYRESQDTFDADTDVFEAAVWGTAVESYRRDPKHFGSAMITARALVNFGMSEAAPLVLVEGLGDQPAPAALGGALELLLASLSRDADGEDVASARRTFQAASALLAVADKPEMRARVEPSSAQVRFLMASIEVRTGNLSGARPLLEAAVLARPTVSGHTMLAMLERQAGQPEAAASHVGRALAAPDARNAQLDTAEAHMLAFELAREAGAQERAKVSLDSALQAVLGARQLGASAAGKSRAERLLGRILDSYGDAKGAVRALERAMQLVANDRDMLAATVLDAVGRALVRRDVTAARAALKRGIEGEVDKEDLIYGGIWLLLLERELKVPTDGTAERALQVGSSRASWTSKLAAWATGKLSDADLGTAAQSPSQRIEVAFYTALSRKVAGDPAAEERLRDVAKAPVIDLLEVQLAREITAPRMRNDIPRNVSLP